MYVHNSETLPLFYNRTLLANPPLPMVYTSFMDGRPYVLFQIENIFFKLDQICSHPWRCVRLVRMLLGRKDWDVAFLISIQKGRKGCANKQKKASCFWVLLEKVFQHCTRPNWYVTLVSRCYCGETVSVVMRDYGRY